MLKGTTSTEGFQSRIAELACIIASKTAQIDGFLAMNDLPPPFDNEAPLDLHLPQDLEAARNLVIDASTELKELLLGPKELLLSHVVGLALMRESRYSKTHTV